MAERDIAQSIFSGIQTGVNLAITAADIRRQRTLSEFQAAQIAQMSKKQTLESQIAPYLVQRQINDTAKSFVTLKTAEMEQGAELLSIKREGEELEDFTNDLDAINTANTLGELNSIGRKNYKTDKYNKAIAVARSDKQSLLVAIENDNIKQKQQNLYYGNLEKLPTIQQAEFEKVREEEGIQAALVAMGSAMLDAEASERKIKRQEFIFQKEVTLRAQIAAGQQLQTREQFTAEGIIDFTKSPFFNRLDLIQMQEDLDLVAKRILPESGEIIQVNLGGPEAIIPDGRIAVRPASAANPLVPANDQEIFDDAEGALLTLLQAGQPIENAKQIIILEITRQNVSEEFIDRIRNLGL